MTYKGGKAGAGVYQQIINQIPPHDVYIEPFFGGGAVLLHKRAAAASIALDVDYDVTIPALEWAMPGLTVITGDAISYLQNRRYGQVTFVYADPPYLMSTRKRKSALYKHEFGLEEEHNRLLDVLLSLPCMVAVSGYSSSLYMARLQGWRHISFNSVTRSGAVAREFLWMNYPEPTALHDYRYLGSNFREREKINRQKKRWCMRLKKMSPLQRYALLSSIAELNDGGSSL